MSDVMDNGNVMQFFANISGDKLIELTTRALKDTGSIFRDHVQANVSSSPLSGKKATRLHVNKDRSTFSVDIFGTPLARIFEGGSYKAAGEGGRKVLHYKKKELATPANRGNIRAYRFLGAAFDAHGSEIADDFEMIFANLIRQQS